MFITCTSDGDELDELLKTCPIFHHRSNFTFADLRGRLRLRDAGCAADTHSQQSTVLARAPRPPEARSPKGDRAHPTDRVFGQMADRRKIFKKEEVI